MPTCDSISRRHLASSTQSSQVAARPRQPVAGVPSHREISTVEHHVREKREQRKPWHETSVKLKTSTRTPPRTPPQTPPRTPPQTPPRTPPQTPPRTPPRSPRQVGTREAFKPSISQLSLGTTSKNLPVPQNARTAAWTSHEEEPDLQSGDEAAGLADWEASSLASARSGTSVSSRAGKLGSKGAAHHLQSTLSAASTAATSAPSSSRGHSNSLIDELCQDWELWAEGIFQAVTAGAQPPPPPRPEGSGALPRPLKQVMQASTRAAASLARAWMEARDSAASLEKQLPNGREDVRRRGVQAQELEALRAEVSALKRSAEKDGARIAELNSRSEQLKAALADSEELRRQEVEDAWHAAQAAEAKHENVLATLGTLLSHSTGRGDVSSSTTPRGKSGQDSKAKALLGHKEVLSGSHDRQDASWDDRKGYVGPSGSKAGAMMSSQGWRERESGHGRMDHPHKSRAAALPSHQFSRQGRQHHNSGMEAEYGEAFDYDEEGEQEVLDDVEPAEELPLSPISPAERSCPSRSFRHAGCSSAHRSGASHDCEWPAGSFEGDAEEFSRHEDGSSPWSPQYPDSPDRADAMIGQARQLESEVLELCRTMGSRGGGPGQSKTSSCSPRGRNR